MALLGAILLVVVPLWVRFALRSIFEIDGARYVLVKEWAAESPEMEALVQNAMKDGKITYTEFDRLEKHSNLMRSAVKREILDQEASHP